MIGFWIFLSALALAAANYFGWRYYCDCKMTGIGGFAPERAAPAREARASARPQRAAI